MSAIKENEALAQGIPPQVSPFLDDHIIHIYEHKKFANSDQGALTKQQMIQHITQHNMIMDAEMNPGLGAPGGPPQQGGKGAKVSPKGEAALNPGKNIGGQLPPSIQ
jgi:hypothetical protein